MSWRDTMGAASFRGVPFFVETSTRGGGRRGVTHEYPKRDVAYREDLGLKARTFSIKAYVIGENYFGDRDALWDALDAVDSGELIHPYYGTRRVSVGDVSVDEGTSEGGWAKFTIEFHETSESSSQPASLLDAVSKVKASAAAVLAAASAEFLRKYSPGALLSDVSSQLRRATVAVNGVVSSVNMETQNLARFKRRVADFERSIDTLVHSPEDLLADLTDIFGLAPFGVSSLYSFDPGERPEATTISRTEEQTCFDASQQLIQRLALSQEATLAPDQTYDSYDSAIEARDSLTALIDDQAQNAADDVYPYLAQLRADIVRALPGAESDLAHLIQHTPVSTIPSLVLAYDLYGSQSMEADLIARNNVQHPGFVPGGAELEVLSDGE